MAKPKTPEFSDAFRALMAKHHKKVKDVQQGVPNDDGTERSQSTVWTWQDGATPALRTFPKLDNFFGEWRGKLLAMSGFVDLEAAAAEYATTVRSGLVLPRHLNERSMYDLILDDKDLAPEMRQAVADVYASAFARSHQYRTDTYLASMSKAS